MVLLEVFGLSKTHVRSDVGYRIDTSIDYCALHIECMVVYRHTFVFDVYILRHIRFRSIAASKLHTFAGFRVL